MWELYFSRFETFTVESVAFSLNFLFIIHCKIIYQLILCIYIIALLQVFILCKEIVCDFKLNKIKFNNNVKHDRNRLQNKKAQK